MTATFARLAFFAAVLTVFAGYLFIFRPAEAAVAVRYERLNDARSTLERSLALTARIPALSREREALSKALRRDHLHDRRAALVEHFLRDVATIAARNRVTVEAIAANLRPTPSATTPARVPLFQELPFDLTVRGRYPDVIRAIRELDAGDVVTRITPESLRDADRHSSERPQLNAAFHVFLLREGDDEPTRKSSQR